MRFAFISDLHGNVPALHAVLADIQRRGCDEVVCLGDIVDLGPEPGAVIELLREREVACIGGNHDPLDEHPGYPMLRDIEAWTQAVLSAEQRSWLASLPFSLERAAHGHTLLGVHGSPRRDTENMDADIPSAALAEMLDGVAQDVVVAGHTHCPLVRRLERQLLVNVGSVGLAFREVFRDGGPAPVVLPFAEYGIVELGEHGISAALHRVNYDLAAYEAAVRASGMPHVEQWMGHIEGNP